MFLHRVCGALKLEKDDIYCYVVQTAVLDYQN